MHRDDRRPGTADLVSVLLYCGVEYAARAGDHAIQAAVQQIEAARLSDRVKTVAVASLYLGIFTPIVATLLIGEEIFLSKMGLEKKEVF